ncbi:uncharacterized protein MELLADRAFT_107777 [Melampsora larici-populina 98AG31]|uniref:RING-type domain-containing protein n=1 Tax=Melampsora larici-populina (strain 98AG31 / pathotype 3-4-7) TaxID=747676 RepID=F4RQW9_MELLP|nr:uncharacterized protein MELLADRAFT_107777 [Melampsora larici-populina 98AG31]EGG05251.1 hypothetical protein MELLADRAFT_107777 [Melampsora larici-populina 98AG31]
MKMMILLWGWCLIIPCSFCVHLPSARLVDKGLSIQEQLNTLETFAPLNEEIEYIKHKAYSSTLMSKFPHRITKSLVAYKRLRNLQKLHPSNREVLISCSEVPHDLMDMVTGVKPWSPIFHNDIHLQNSIITALQRLQRKDLEIYKRLWILSVLDILQSLLPRGELNPIRGDPKTGSVCRGGLELFLLKGLDYTPRVKSFLNRRIEFFPVDGAVAEALKRVELIADIRGYLRYPERSTPTLKNLHDQLLLNRSLAEGNILESLISQLLQFKIVENTTRQEMRFIYQIMEHLELFYPDAKQFAVTEALERLELIMKTKYYRHDYLSHQETYPEMIKVYNTFIQVESVDNAKIVKDSALQVLQHISLKAKAEGDVEWLYQILQYVERVYPNSPDVAITESLERVEYIMKIREYLKDAEEHRQTLQVMRFYNHLLPTSSLVDTEIVNSLALECMQYMVLFSNSEHDLEAFKFVNSILSYLEKFHESAKQLVKSWSSTNELFRTIQLGIQCQVELKPHLLTYAKQKDKDPYIMLLLSPFKGRHLVDSAYVKQCLHKLNIKDSALAASEEGISGLDVSKEKYYKNQDFFIKMMYKASPYIEGLEEYLKRHVWKNEASGHYRFVLRAADKDETFGENIIRDENYAECAICKSEFVMGENIVKLKCGNVPHMFHKDCLNDWIARSKGRIFKCPTCMKPTKSALTQDLLDKLRAHHKHMCES